MSEDCRDASEDGWFGALLLDQIEKFLGRFIAYPSGHARVAHVLWIVHTHLMDCWNSTPRLAFQSAERGSGKTRALEITGLLVPNPVQSVNCTPAYLSRKIGDEAGRPTILYDEIDCLFNSKVADTGEVKALLNAGHRPGAVTGRCIVIGKRVETEELPAYCAVAVAGIGDLPDTLGSRSIIIDMRRRSPDEDVEPYRHRLHAAGGESVRFIISEFAAAIGPTVAEAMPTMPEGITDRDADCWEPLIAIADVAGGDWPGRARYAAADLVASGHERTQTRGVQLLKDLYEVFGGAEKLATETILARLHDLPKSAWKDIRGKPLDDRGLATRLKPYFVKPRRIRIGDNTFRGYYATDLHDPWKRYLGVSRTYAPQAEQRHNGEGCGSSSPERVPQSATQKAAENPEKYARCGAVADVADTSQEEVDGVADCGAKVVDGDPFASMKDGSLKLQPSPYDYPDLPGELDRTKGKKISACTP